MPAALGRSPRCGWLLGLPAWGLLLSRWSPENPLRVGQLLAFLGLLVLGMAIFTFNIIWVIFSLGLFLLPLIPPFRLANGSYRAGPLQAGIEIFLAVAAVVVAFAIPTPESAWSSPWIYSGGAATAGLMIACRAARTTDRSSVSRHSNGAVL